MNASHENTLNSLQSLILLVGVVIALVGVFIYGKSRPN